MHRAMPWRKQAVLGLAGLAGKLANSLLRTAPGLLGAGLITLGAGLIFMPAGLLVGGVFLLLVDRRMPS